MSDLVGNPSDRLSHDPAHYAPNFEKVDGAYCFWSVHALVRGCVGGSHFLYLL